MWHLGSRTPQGSNKFSIAGRMTGGAETVESPSISDASAFPSSDTQVEL